MIIVSGPAENWDHIAEATGDPGWRGDRMRAYFERLEHCHYNRRGFFDRIRRFFGLSTGWEDGRHGTRGWFQTTTSDLRFLFRDRRPAKVVLEGAYGVIQALARAGWLRHVDFLSTVSGGGYTGGFLGRVFDPGGKRDGVTGAIPTPEGGAGQERVARDLVGSRSEPISWLRRHSNHLSPTGHGQFAANLAAFWRNLTSVRSAHIGGNRFR
ncbi:hypothetical protein GobsT_07680 [Gemmata obscuriglobus]|uniref:Uncharacterized protein n=1 Tax=Gemmata obscuriglobus TaxID=114 RepID=A0A2Z3HH38_9BACT|nr:hypothetical protein [Gemmata obscuriglobus]AWM40700.1 hypothetical protein C1280_29420 [Gemmata obscuriglobus]QEG26033.1 hypothetical protein GobsT_07680 [Gemmata obscuriglobus]VTS00382.1 glucose-methanol-choline oxidoreductase : Uncharacterized protein OS=Sorangium cellulosum (strain So ce56) GN=sce5632 PE=3 SV=1 [Gemmata obscuriglobus UQM 2246]